MKWQRCEICDMRTGRCEEDTIHHPINGVPCCENCFLSYIYSKDFKKKCEEKFKEMVEEDNMTCYAFFICYAPPRIDHILSFGIDVRISTIPFFGHDAYTVWFRHKEDYDLYNLCKQSPLLDTVCDVIFV